MKKQMRLNALLSRVFYFTLGILLSISLSFSIPAFRVRVSAEAIAETAYLTPYGGDGFSDYYSEGLCWTGLSESWSSRGVDKIGVIDTNGRIIFSITEQELKDQYLGHVFMPYVRTTPFQDGFSVIYAIPSSQKYASAGFAVVNAQGEITFSSEVAEGSETNYIFMAQYGDQIVAAKNVAGFAENTTYLFVLDPYGREIAGPIEITDPSDYGNLLTPLLYDRGNGILTDESGKYFFNIQSRKQFIVQVSSSSYDGETTAAFPTWLTTRIYDGKALLCGRNIYNDHQWRWIDISALTDEASAEQAISEPIENSYFWHAEDVGEGLVYEDYRVEPGYYDLNGNLAVTFPTYPSAVQYEDHSSFEDGYAMLVLTGADGKQYVTAFDRSGEQLYQPVQIDGRVRTDAVRRHMKGYIPVENKRGIQLVSPQGQILTAGVDDLSELGTDAYLSINGNVVLSDGFFNSAYLDQEIYKTYVAYDVDRICYVSLDTSKLLTEVYLMADALEGE